MYTLILLINLLSFNFQEGDLLFQDCDCGAMCDAIEEVTTGYNKARFSHIAMVVSDRDTLKVIEANVYGVKIVSLEQFLDRYKNPKGQPMIAIGRLKESYKPLIPKAVEYSKSLIGKGYDTVFLLNNDMYYCSELIYESFKSSNKGKDFFKLNKMTFKRPKENTFQPTFKQYYSDMGCTIPEGKLGINPGAISRDSKINIRFFY